MISETRFGFLSGAAIAYVQWWHISHCLLRYFVPIILSEVDKEWRRSVKADSWPADVL